MSIHTIAHLTDALRRSHLLEETQLRQVVHELLPRYTDPRSLATELERRGWLSPYQVNQLFQGKESELLLGSYVLLEKLGEGGMGQVFKARNWKCGGIVALKIIRPERLADEGLVRRFYREIRAATSLHHPKVVHAHAADEVNGRHLLVMEYVEGIDLAKRVQQGGPLPVEAACDSVRQAALGLQHAHECGMVHRDIKPANLMLTPQGVIKVLDMGLARLNPSEIDGKSSQMTIEGAMMGTPDYVAPEQALEPHGVDIRADLYSLGCTFYFLLSGQVPFPSRTLADKLLKHQLSEPRPIEHLRPDVPAAVARVVRKLMAKRPSDRYQTPAELVAALAGRVEEDDRVRDEEKTLVQGRRATACALEATHDAAQASIANEDDTRPTGASQARQNKEPHWLRYGAGACLVLLASLTAWWFFLKPSARVALLENTAIQPADKGAATVDEPWLQEVAALPAEQQVEAVIARLKERNPEFDGKVTHTIERGVVTHLQFATDHVTDIAPVRALTSLRRLDCGGRRGEGKLDDLSPLKGMKLTALACAGTQVSDLSPLAGMQLEELNVWYTPVSDLSPLRGMKLTILGCGGTQVADLAPLRDMALEELNVWGTRVWDLSPLQGMKLTTLACGSTAVSDLAPLRGMMLTTLHCDHTRVKDLSPLQGMRLICLSCEKTPVVDLSPLKDMPLARISCDIKGERDIEILRSIKTLQTINGKPAAPFWKEVHERRSLPP